MYAGYDQPAAAPVNLVGLQQDAGQEKNDKVGKLGNTMDTYAAGGVSFGAGAALALSALSF